MILSKQILENMGACPSAIEWCEKHKLFGFDLSLLNTIKGDYNHYIEWMQHRLQANVYNKDGLLLYGKVPDRYRYKLEYDNNGNKTKCIYHNGNFDEYFYNDSNQLVKLVASDGDVSEWTYSPSGKELNYTVNGSCCEYSSYDDQDRLISCVSIPGSSSSWVYDDTENTCTFSIGDIPLMVTRFDECGRQILLDSGGIVSTWEYDDRGNELAVVLDGCRCESVYDEHNNKVFHRDHDGTQYTMVYDNHNNKVLHRMQMDGHATFQELCWVYDYWPNGQLKQLDDLYIPFINKD